MHVYPLAILESDDKGLREAVVEGAAQLINLVIVGRGTGGIFKHTVLAIIVCILHALQLRIVGLQLNRGCQQLHLENGRIRCRCLRFLLYDCGLFLYFLLNNNSGLFLHHHGWFLLYNSNWFLLYNDSGFLLYDNGGLFLYHNSSGLLLNDDNRFLLYDGSGFDDRVSVGS